MYRLIWGKQISQQCWVFRPMNMVYLSIFRSSFLWTLFYSFQCINLAHLLSDLSLHILYIYAIMKDSVFSILISYCLLLTYRHKIDFFSLSILYPTTLPNSLISFSSFCFVDSIGFSIWPICHLWIRTVFLFQDVGLYFFVLSIWLARIPNTMLNQSAENGHPCFDHNLKEKASVFHHKVWCCRFFIDIT